MLDTSGELVGDGSACDHDPLDLVVPGLTAKLWKCHHKQRNVYL